MNNDNISPQRKVLIVEDETLVGMGLRQQLERLGHSVVGQASNAVEAFTLFHDARPDVVLMDISLDETDGIELAKELLARRPCPMVIVSAFSDPKLIERAAEAGVFGYLIKPVSGESLAAQIGVAVRRFEQHQALFKEKEQLELTLENRKTIERAKGIFMKRLHLEENEAHRRLQLESQKRRMSLVDLAKKILESEELLGG